MFDESVRHNLWPLKMTNNKSDVYKITRQRAAQRVATENDEQREYRLEEQRRRD